MSEIRTRGELVTGSAMQLMVNSVSPSIMPGEILDDTQVFPTTVLLNLFGEDEDWMVRGEQIGGAILRHLRLADSRNTERAVRAAVDWLRDHHPGASDVRVEWADHRAIHVVLGLEYPPRFLRGLLQRIAWDTRADRVEPDADDPYRFSIIL